MRAGQIWVAVAVCSCWGTLALAQHPAHKLTPAERAQQYRIEAALASSPIRIDGILDEPVWQQAMHVADFVQKFPTDSVAARNTTEVRMAYDDKMLYIAARCHESQPGNYVITSLQRDFDGGNNDVFTVVIDPFNDQTNGFLFSVSPMGVQREGLVSYSNRLSTDWDNRWYTETRRREGGWDIEIAIPFKSIRFPAGKAEWRINFVRGSLRQNEYSSWIPVPINLALVNLLFTGTVEFAQAPAKPSGNVALIPYVLGSGTRNYQQPPGSPVTDWQVGGDAKVALGPGLNLDLTVNPDFAQAEVDRQQINLTQFDLFFPERRQFFLENSDLFASFGFSTIRPFFSRRIGLNTSIVAGARLSGKLGRDWRLGLMTIQTEGRAETGLNAQNYTVAAVQRQLGTHNIGLIAVNRQGWHTGIGENGSFSGEDYNRVLGVDFNLQSANGKWLGKVFYHQSFTPARFLQTQPYAHASWLRFNNRRWEINWNHEVVGRDYRAEVGFVPRLIYRNPVAGTTERRGFVRIEPDIGYSFWPEGGRVVRHGPWVYVNQYHFLADGRRSDAGYFAGYDVEFRNSAEFSVFAAQRHVFLPFPLNIGLENDSLIPAQAHTWYVTGFEATTNIRKPLSTSFRVEVGQFYGGHRQQVGGGITYRSQPWGIWQLNGEWNRIRLPQGEADLFLIGPEARISFSRSVFLSTVVQYNTSSEQVAHTTRLQWRFRPMSDLFIVYSDLHNQALVAQQQGLLVKLVWWLQG